jgi:hypothetical protein
VSRATFWDAVTARMLAMRAPPQNPIVQLHSTLGSRPRNATFDSKGGAGNMAACVGREQQERSVKVGRWSIASKRMGRAVPFPPGSKILFGQRAFNPSRALSS